MNQVMALIMQTKQRTVYEVRARAKLEHRVVKAIQDKWTIGRIMAKWRCPADYVYAVAKEHGLSVERPSDYWIGRPY